MIPEKDKRDTGAVLFIVIIFGTVLLLIGYGIMQFSASSRILALKSFWIEKAGAAAEAGVEQCAQYIITGSSWIVLPGMYERINGTGETVAPVHNNNVPPNSGWNHIIAGDPALFRVKVDPFNTNFSTPSTG